MNIRDSAIWRPDSFIPMIDRLLVDEFDEGPGYSTYRRRGTTDWLLIHTLAGQGRFGRQGPDILARSGETILIRPGVLHDYGIGSQQQRWHFMFAHFHPRSEWLPLLDWPDLGPGILRIRSGREVQQRIEASLGEAIRFTQGVLKNGELFGMNALEAALLWCDTQNPAKEQIDERLLKAIELIERNPRQDLDARRLAKASTLSVSRFAHLFRVQLGVSPQRFVERRRLDAAAQLLDFTSRPVSSVAAEVGFADPLYFSTRFRRQTGMSPTAYRARR